MHSAQFYFFAEPFLKIERRDDRKEVHDDVIVDHVVSVRFKSLEIKRSKVHVQLGSTEIWDL